MGCCGNSALMGLSSGLYNISNIAFGGLTSYYMSRSGVDPFYTCYVNLDSPSGFSSWAHPAYATRSAISANASGIDTTWAPFTSSVSSALFGSSYSSFGGGLFGGGLFGGGLFGGGLLGGSSWLGGSSCCSHRSISWIC